LGEGAKVHTPTKYLDLKGRVKDTKDLYDRFSVEVLTKEFYTELFAWYQWALSDDIGVTFPNDRSTESDDRKIEEHLIRLITRLMFVWFIKQKKLVPDGLFEVENLKTVLKNFEATNQKQDTFYRAILQNLFFATLNNRIEERDFAVDSGYPMNKVHFGIKTLFRYADDFSVPKKQVIQIFSKVPFLNGGLFECLDKDTPDSNGKIVYSDGFSRKTGRQSRAFIPNILFFEPEKGILSILNKYNFTIEENSPLDVEVALDPELLGKVFENLLGTYNPETKETARKQSGSFYTPREIVQYMVDESLVAHLKRTVGDELETEYRKLINHTDDTVLLTEQQKSDIFKSLKACKILDPACGSGAFPMGILNRMLAIIERLPIPANISVYDLKLYLIENCIYGIDIQSIAVQISKLRFFISLICEQQPNADSANNFGIKPLPNLETKFVAANTLIGLTPKNAQLNLFEDPQIDVTRNELMQIRHKHFLASTSKQKKECRDEDKKLREKLAGLLDDNGNFAPDDARQLADWNPYDQNASSPFFDTEWMFGIKDGFDVVIGNPPYKMIQPHNTSATELEFYKSQYSLVKFKIDLFHLFFIKSLKYLSNDGSLCFIAPSTLLLNTYVSDLRQFIIKNHFLNILAINSEKVFENADVHTAIYLIGNNKSNKKTRYSLDLFEVLNNKNCYNSIFQDDWLKLPNKEWNLLLDPEKIKLISKIQKNSYLLSDISKINRGLITGNKDEFFSTTKLNDDYVEILAGSDVHRFRYNEPSKFVKFIKTKASGGCWDSNVHFAKEKILIRQIGTKPTATLIKKPIAFTGNLFSIISNIQAHEYLLSIINSKLISYYWRIMFSDFKETFPQVTISSISSIPIKKHYDQQLFKNKIDRLLEKYNLNTENQLDLMVYKLYELSYDEAMIVDPELGKLIGREDYERRKVEELAEWN